MKYLSRVNATKAAIAALTGVLFLTFAYFVSEPAVSRAITDQFIVTQTITDEISFLVAAANVTMSPSLGGITGGYATGTTYFVVRSNSITGYYVDINFSSTTAMGRTHNGGFINNYSPTATTAPDYAYSLNATAAEFAYTVSASTTANLDQSFKDNGSACNTGSADALNKCWQNPSTTPERIILTSAATPSTGATTTIKFKVAVPSNPSPALPEGTYTATATLTAINN